VSDIGAVHQRFVPGYTLNTQLDGKRDFWRFIFTNGNKTITPSTIIIEGVIMIQEKNLNPRHYLN